jgi:hypothetical protein
LKNLGEVTNAENIKAHSPKILKPTHFWSIKDNKADLLKLENKAENVTNIKADWDLSGVSGVSKH